MKCPKCGAEISDNADVCDNCGQPIYEIHKKSAASHSAFTALFRLLKKSVGSASPFAGKLPRSG